MAEEKKGPPWWLEWFAGGALAAVGWFLAETAICLALTSGSENDEEDEEDEE